MQIGGKKRVNIPLLFKSIFFFLNKTKERYDILNEKEGTKFISKRQIVSQIVSAIAITNLLSRECAHMLHE